MKEPLTLERFGLSAALALLLFPGCMSLRHGTEPTCPQPTETSEELVAWLFADSSMAYDRGFRGVEAVPEPEIRALSDESPDDQATCHALRNRLRLTSRGIARGGIVFYQANQYYASVATEGLATSPWNRVVLLDQDLLPIRNRSVMVAGPFHGYSNFDWSKEQF